MADPDDPASPPRAMPEPPPPPPDPSDPRSVAAWRREMRTRLIAERRAIPVAAREEMTARIARHLDTVLPEPSGRVVSLYWPFRGEPDLRGWAEGLIARGARLALPVVVETAAPLVFRHWGPGAAMTRGVWNIPVPEAGPELVPDILLAPVVGFDPGRYRLGYGGGFFDRTLAAHPGDPLAIGVGFDAQALDTIHPQPHDIPMARIVTESGPR
jgi:5,10-methenyltetrahydrofolate synthetase